MAPFRVNCVFRPGVEFLHHLVIRGWDSPVTARRVGSAMTALKLDDGDDWVQLARLLFESDPLRLVRLGENILASQSNSWLATWMDGGLDLSGVVNSREAEYALGICSGGLRRGMVLFARPKLTIRYDTCCRENVLYLEFRDERQARTSSSYYVLHILDRLGVPLEQVGVRLLVAYQRLVGASCLSWYGQTVPRVGSVRISSLTLLECEDPYSLGVA